MSEIGNLAKLQEENRKALLERQQRLLTWEKFKKDYESLEEVLTTLPKKISHEALVPLSSVAFMPGKLVHTNEIMVLLGDNWFAERSAYQALEILERRKKYLESNIAGIKEDIKAFQSRLEFTADIQAAAQENSEVKEIKEELTLLEAEGITSRSSRTAHPRAQKVGGSKKVEGLKSTTKINGAKDKKDEHHFSAEDFSLFARLDELEILEEKNAEFNQLEGGTLDNKTCNIKEEVETELLQKNTGGIHHGKVEKKVTWQADFNKKDGNGSSTSEEDEEEESSGNTICVEFTPSRASTKQGKIPDSLSDSSVLVTPGDIYSHFTHNQGMKPILKKPTVEENTGHTSADKTIGDTHLENPIGGGMVNTETSYQKAFSGTIVERQGLQREQHSCEKSPPPQAGKKLSRFKASRQ